MVQTNKLAKTMLRDWQKQKEQQEKLEQERQAALEREEAAAK